MEPPTHENTAENHRFWPSMVFLIAVNHVLDLLHDRRWLQTTKLFFAVVSVALGMQVAAAVPWLAGRWDGLNVPALVYFPFMAIRVDIYDKVLDNFANGRPLVRFSHINMIAIMMIITSRRSHGHLLRAFTTGNPSNEVKGAALSLAIYLFVVGFTIGAAMVLLIFLLVHKMRFELRRLGASLQSLVHPFLERWRLMPRIVQHFVLLLPILFIEAAFLGQTIGAAKTMDGMKLTNTEENLNITN